MAISLRRFWRAHNIAPARKLHNLERAMRGNDFLEEERDRVLDYMYSPRVTATGMAALGEGAMKWTNHCRSVRYQNHISKKHLRNKPHQGIIRKYQRVMRDHPYAPGSALNKELNRRFSDEAF